MKRGSHDVLIQNLRARCIRGFFSDGFRLSGDGNCLGRAARVYREDTMIVMELQYDAHSRTFRPLDNDAAGIFEDGKLYLTVISDSGEVHFEPIDFRHTHIAHA